MVVADDDLLRPRGSRQSPRESGPRCGGTGRRSDGVDQQVRNLLPELVIIDIGCHRRSQQKVSRGQGHRRGVPDIAILVLSAHVEVEQATGLIRVVSAVVIC